MDDESEISLAQNLNVETKENVVSNETQQPFYYILLRLYFIFFPINALIVKIGVFPFITFWKDAVYLICFFLGFKYLIKGKNTFIYLSIIALIIISNLVQGRLDLEYITWFIIGIPIYLYFKFITPRDFDIDCYIIAILMIIGALYVLIFEIHGGYEFFFVAPTESSTTLQRDNAVRIRWAFLSPMAYSQYSWFFTLVLFLNKRLSKILKYTALLAVGYGLIANNTRAGWMLMGLSIIVFCLNYLIKPNRFINFILVISSVVIIISMIIISALKVDLTDTSDTSASIADLDRITIMANGVEIAQENAVLGKGGEFYSPRSGKWLDTENAWLPFIACFGILGIALGLHLLGIFLFKTTDKMILLFSLPWVIYSFIFPVFQESCAIVISWFILSMILDENKSNLLFTYPNLKKIVFT